MNELTLETLEQLYDIANVTITINDGMITAAHIE